MTEEDIVQPGLIGIGDSPSDFQFGADLELPKPRMTYWDKQLQYYQPEISKVSCTIHGAFGCVSDLIGYNFTMEQRKEMWAEALRRGADPNVGWYLRSAVDLVREYATRYTGIALMSFKVALLEPSFVNAINAGYTVNMGYSGNSAYNADKNDGHLEGLDFGARTYGHAVRIVKSKDAPDSVDVIVDNYLGRTTKPNTYTVPVENIKKLVLNGCFYHTGYVFVVKEDFESMNDPKAPLWATVSLEKARKAGIITDQADPYAPVELNPEDKRSRFEWVVAKVGGYRAFFHKLGLANIPEGDFNISHLAVILDRAGFLD